MSTRHPQRQSAGRLRIGLALALTATAAAWAGPALAAEEGMRIARDPETGQLRAPSHEEIKALEAQERAAAAKAGRNTTMRLAPPTIQIKANGAKRAQLDESHMTYSVMKRRADGTLAMECVTGHEAAHQALATPATAQHSKEHDHEAQ